MYYIYVLVTLPQLVIYKHIFFPQNLVHQMEILSKSKSEVSNELNKSKEDNEELKFQVRKNPEFTLGHQPPQTTTFIIFHVCFLF